MKSHFRWLFAIAVVGAGLITGCTTQAEKPVVVSPTGLVYVPEAPPSQKTELPGQPPSTASVWVPGYWTYHDTRWVWLPGHWRIPPQTGKSWVTGHWDHDPRGWIWTPGHWE